MFPVSPKFLVIGALLLAVAGGMGYLWVKWKASEAEVTQVKAEKKLVEVDRDEAIAANKTNMETIDRLQQEKVDIGDALKKLQEDQAQTQRVISGLSASIRKQATNPANQVGLSPVLQETVQSIQAQRELRKGAQQ